MPPNAGPTTAYGPAARQALSLWITWLPVVWPAADVSPVAIRLFRSDTVPGQCIRQFTASIMRSVLLTAFLLCCSNVFMTFSWYGHLLNLATKPWLIAALASWGIALFEYLLQVPANRIGHQVLTLGQFKILHEVLALTIFVQSSVYYTKEKVTLDYLWAGLCLLDAAFFIFRRHWTGN